MMTSEAPATSPPITLRGYIEGYYGRLLDWPERHRILDRLADKVFFAWTQRIMLSVGTVLIIRGVLLLD